MKNKTVKMVLAVVVLGVCCGAYAGVKTYVAHQEQKESEEDSEESTTVFTASTDNIKSLDFMVDDTETTFEKDDDSWVKKDETDFPVNQTTLDSAASAIASVDSDRVLEDVDDLSEYGLDSPSNTIKIVTKSDEEDGDDITTTLYVGDENSSTSQYYVRKDDDEKTVYLIDSSCVEPFTKSLNDYAQMEDFPAISNTDTITKISVDGDNSYELSKDEDTSTWSVKGSEDEEKADSATVSSLVSSFGSMAYSSLADYKCDDKSKYGLDKPYATITVDYQEEVTSSAEENSDDAEQDTESDESVSETTDETSEAEDTDGEEAEDETSENSDSASDDEDSSEEETKMADKQLTILVGNETDDSNRYVMVNDSNEVYAMSEDTLSALTDKSEEDFWDMTVSYISLNSLGSLKVNYQGSDYKVNVSRETSTDDDGNDTETVTYKLNGSDLDETTFTTFYNKLINMTAQKRLTDKYEPDGDAELIATFTEEDGDTLEVAYYSYDTNYYAAVVDNKVYLVNKMNVKELFTAFESVVGTEEDSSDKTDSDEATTDDTKSDSTDTSGESIEESDDSTSEAAGTTNNSDTSEEENTDSQETDSTEE
nr:DUF4340 domain-containing protein [uncultured Blautia sp.]